jgi:hypothetical protein
MSTPDNSLQGNGPTFQAACENAFGKRGHSDPTTYVIDEITVTGNNPLTGYTVVMHPKK